MAEQQQQHGKARVIYDEPASPAGGSVHYQSLMQRPARNTSDNNNSSSNNSKDDYEETRSSGNVRQSPMQLMGSHDELLRAFQNDVVTHLNDDEDEGTSCSSSSERRMKKKYILLAQWSCILGYCEALSTHPSTRYELFPLPITALQQLVTADFLPLLDNSPMTSVTTTTTNNDIKGAAIEGESLHRRTVRAIANAIWKKARKNKKKSSNSNNNRDELHANSLYTRLCGNIDNKSLDCFNITLLVVIGMNILGFTNSTLTKTKTHFVRGDGSTGIHTRDGKWSQVPSEPRRFLLDWYIPRPETSRCIFD